MSTQNPIETVRVSKQGKDQLVKLKRHTKISNWNVLCRWAFCVSLAELSPPQPHKVPGESPVEMTWRTFGGDHEEVYLALLKERCHADGLDQSDKTLVNQFRLHLHRGIGYLAGSRKLKSIEDLIRLARVDAED